MQEPFVHEQGITWRELAIRDHRLAQFKRRVEWVRDDGTAPSFCANDHWYGRAGRLGLRDQLARLVGPQARPDDPILGTGAALVAAGATLRLLLPPCRDCACADLTNLSSRDT
jgi:hypothetical protein